MLAMHSTLNALPYRAENLRPETVESVAASSHIEPETGSSNNRRNGFHELSPSRLEVAANISGEYNKRIEIHYVFRVIIKITLRSKCQQSTLPKPSL